MPVLPPAITAQSPSITNITYGGSATLSVTAGGSGLSYQWYQGVSGTTTTPITGATNAVFTTPALTTTTDYWVTITNAGGSVASNTMKVSVPPSQTITFPAIGNRLMTSPTVSLAGTAAATTTSGLPITYAVTSGPATLSDTTLTLTGEGSVTVSASQEGTLAYRPASESQTFLVSRASQSIAFPSIGDRLMTSPAVSLTGATAATTTSGLPITYFVVSGPATLNDTTLNLTGVGSVTISASQVGDLAYHPASAAQTFTVSRASQPINFPTIGNRLMTSPNVSLTGAAAATTTSGLPITYAVVSGPATLTGTTLTLTGKGSVTVSASHMGDIAHNPASVTQTFTVSRASQTIIFPAIGDRLMSSPTVSLTGAASTTTGLPITYAVVSGPATLSGTTLTLTGAGTVMVRARQAGNTLYAAASATQTFSVSRVSQTITFQAIANRLFSTESFALPGTASSGLPVTYSIVSGPAVVNGFMLQMTGAGTITVRASQAGNKTYLPAEAVNVTFSAAPSLSKLAVTGATLNPNFTSGNTLYTASVPNTTSSVIVTPSTILGSAILKVNETTVESGTSSAAIPLVVGSNVITVMVAAPGGTPSRIYQITVTRAASSVRTLSRLAVQGATLSPTFSPSNTSYTATVANSTTSLKVTPTAKSSVAKIAINGQAINSGTISNAIELKTGTNVISIVVTAQNGSKKTYKITVTRALAASSAVSAPIALATLDMEGRLLPPKTGVVTSVERIGGLKYLAIKIHKPKGRITTRPRVEVSSNLVDWYSGNDHTTVVEDSATVLRVRDNTPVTPERKRYMRVSSRP